MDATSSRRVDISVNRVDFNGIKLASRTKFDFDGTIPVSLQTQYRNECRFSGRLHWAQQPGLPRTNVLKNFT